MWLRIVGSLAAPTFVSLAGMMTAFGERPAPLVRLLKRGLMLLAVAAAIDVLCWRITPFETFDVLYLLGVAVPVVGVCTHLGLAWHWLLALAVIIAAPAMQHWVGYDPTLTTQPGHWASVWRAQWVSGWFPIFPWLGVAMLGGAVARTKPLAPGRASTLALSGAGLACAGALGWWLVAPAIPTRGGYSELFYPASLQYLAIALGTIALLLAGLHRVMHRDSLPWLTLLGRSSLLMYIGHTVVIALLGKRFRDVPLGTFLALYAALLASMWCLAWLVRRFRDRPPFTRRG